MTDTTGGPVAPPGAPRRHRHPRPAVDRRCSRAATPPCARGLGTTLPVFIERAGGGVLVDVDGNSLIDLGSGIAVVSVGNARRRAWSRASRRRSPRSPTPASWSRRTRATSRSARRSTGSPRATTPRSRRCSTPAPRPSRTPSRSPASHTGRDAVVVFDHGYHGRTNLTMAMTAKNMPYKHGLRAVRRRGLPGADVLPVPLADRAGQRGAEALRAGDRQDRQGGRRRQRRRDRHRADRRARAASSCRRQGFLPGARRRSPRDNGIVFVADEIQTGFARTGAMFACEHEGVVPDLITTAKGIAGGLPLAAVTGRAEIMDAAARRRPRRHLRRQPGRLRRRARRDRDDRERATWSARARAHRRRHAAARCATCRRSYPVIGDVRGRGAMIAIELVRARHASSPTPRPPRRSRRPATREGVLVLTAGTYGNVLRFLPPLVIRDDLLDEALDRPREGASPRLIRPERAESGAQRSLRMPHGEPYATSRSRNGTGVERLRARARRRPTTRRRRAARARRPG